MFNLLTFIRFFVYAVFIISQAITTSVAVWNMSTVQANATFFTVAAQVDVYLIVLGSAGLLLIFPIIFVDILGKSIFVCKVWFELLWVSLYGILMLIGASLVTSLSTTQLCVPNQFVRDHLVASIILISPCSSAQVLQVFTWTPAVFLCTYATLLAILSFVRRKEDPAVWFCVIREFPWQKALYTIKRNSQLLVLPASRARSPMIYAPKPRYIIPPLLSCRSARNSAYEPTQPPTHATWSAPAIDSFPSGSRQSPQQPIATTFYHSSVQKAISTDGGSHPPPPPPARVRREPAASPPPLGDWPRLDATSRPRTKRSGHSVPPAPAPQSALPRPPQPPPRSPPSARRLPPLSTDASVLPPRISPSRTRPPGSGHSSGSMERERNSPVRRPPPLDLSKISTHRTRSHRTHSSR